jgi:bifunctional DNA primase/polymerase-like protein/AAA domain-containing protein
VNATLAAALAYAAQGLRVLPLDPAVPGDEATGKRPISALCPNGVLSASDDPATLERWWAAHPAAGIGLAIPSDWVVVDVDPRNGGAASYDAITKEHGPEAWPETLEAATGGGGAHLVYKIPEGARFPGKLPGRKGLDIKAIGGYVVAWPSAHHTGGAYEWVRQCEPAPLPEWLARLERGVASAEPSAPGAEDRELTPAECSSLDDFAAALEPHFELGQRNALAVAIGGALRNAGLPPSAAGYVIDQLPSTAPEKRLSDALRAWAVPAAAGMSGLRAILPAWAMAGVEAIDLSPDWQRRAKERHAAQRQAEAERAPAEPKPAALTEAEILSRLGVVSLATTEAPIDYVFPGLGLAKSKGKITLMAGPAGAGKGPALLRTFVGIATGRGAWDLPCRRAKCLLLDHEGAYLTRRRVRRICVGLGIDPAELDGWLYIADVSAMSAASDEYRELVEATVSTLGVEVLGLDSYTSAMLDAGLEANQPEFALLAKALGQLGVCVVAIAHANKASADREGPPRLSDVAYTGALGAMAQTAIMVRNPDEADLSRVEISCARAPEDRFPTIHAVWTDTDWRDARDGETRGQWLGLKVDVTAPAATEPSKADKRQAEAEQMRLAIARVVCDVLRGDGSASHTALKSAAHVGAPALDSVLGEMITVGIVERFDTGTCSSNGDKVYRYRLAHPSPRVAEARMKWGLTETQ